MIIDCHGHYTTAPAAHTAWREQQVAAWEAGTTAPAYPSISDDEVLIKITSTAINPVDWKIPVYKLSYIEKYPAILGSDTAGTVEEVGEGVTNFVKGDRV